MNPIERRVLMLRKGIKQADIAREYGCSKVSVHEVIEGKQVSRGIRELLARRLDVSVDRLFPETRRRAA